MIQLKKIIGKIEVKSGLHIGGGNDKVEIGGMDNPVIKNPLTGEPYIPGSSIKGKMRALLEWKEGLVGIYEGKPCQCGGPDCHICRVFGHGNSNDPEEQRKARLRGPTRLIVRDAELSEEYKEKNLPKGKQILEDKKENCLNRITAHANPRPLERVVPGVTFEFEIVYRIIDMEYKYKEDDLALFDSVVKEGLRLLEKDFLGGGGSRGNGRIKFVDLKDENGKEIKL